MRFSHQNTKLYAAVIALQPENNNFLDVKMVQSLLDLVDRSSVEGEFDVAKTYVAKFNCDRKTKLTTTKLLSEHCKALKAMPALRLAMKLSKNLPRSVRTLFCSENYHQRWQAINEARSQIPSSPTWRLKAT